jgi:hypothetical protein
MRQVFHAPSGARGIDPAPARMTGTDAANPETPTAPLLFKFALAMFARRGPGNIESGEGGPCLTDAAHAAALDEPLVSGFAATLRSERIPKR